MTDLLDATVIDTPDDHAFGDELHSYLAAVATGLGVRPESCSVDLLSPASAYITLDGPALRFPDGDLALLWNERFGWSVAVATPDDEDLRVLAHHGGGQVPRPSEVYAFVSAVRAGDHPIASWTRPNPPAPLTPRTRSELVLLLRAAG
ncbi:MAG TPA: DUF6292 family protein [Pseudonocardiaceae bacterium]|jgi:hypothetical protein|nr:DUF6292 family protein [Pseudonocardiaceae bacterium]